MYNKIPGDIKPKESSVKITYASSFDFDLCLLLRERTSTSLADMQGATLEVDSNVLEENKLRNKDDRDIPRERPETSTSVSSATPPQMDEVTKLLKSISTRMEKMEVEGNPTYINPQNVDNRGNFRNPNNNAPQIMPREQMDRDRNDQKIHTPLQNNLVADEER
jgi:beta-lactam-binding protein with PASTA domain